MGKKHLSRPVLLVLSVFVFILASPSFLLSQPVKHISPPTIYSPIYIGTEIVGIEGKAGYRISVYANDTDLVGHGELNVLGWGPVRLERPLKKDDVITATQSNNDDTGYPTWSKHAVNVEAIPSDLLINKEKFYPPKIVEPLYRCQDAFWVEDLIQGVQATYELLNPATESGHSQTPYQNVIIRVRASNGLEKNQTVSALQSFPTWSFPPKSDSSPAVPVLAPPSFDDSKYKPSIVKDTDNDGIDDVSVGTTALAVCNTITGAKVRIYSVDPSTGLETEFGGGVVAGGCTLVIVKPLTDPNIRAQQWLCDNEPKSPPSDPVTLKQAIGLPEIEQPICEGEVEVTVLKTEPTADVEIEVKPKDQISFEGRGVKTASATTTTVPVGGGVSLMAGDEVRVQQRNTILRSNWTTPPVQVSGFQKQPLVEVRNGFHHQAVPGNVPVFYRGRIKSGKYGPVFRVVMCGAEKAIVHIFAPLAEGLQQIEVVELKETKEGYFEGGWDWKHAGWTIPNDIPIGKYIAKFKVTGSAGKSQQDEDFFVAFDPEEVRKNVVTATQNFKGEFPRRGDDYLDGGNQSGIGLKESTINSYFLGTPPSKKVDCLGAAFMIMAKGLIMTLNSNEFDNLKYDTLNMNLKNRFVADISQMNIGDWGYIRNDWSYRQKHPDGGYQGENVIKVSMSEYYGFPIGKKTYKQWEQELIDAYNSPPVTPSAYINSIPGFTDDANFFNMIEVSVDVWNLRKP